ncbi:CUB and sushi domain-containing protein 1, partial [Fragariocoptes setiger]
IEFGRDRCPGNNNGAQSLLSTATSQPDDSGAPTTTGGTNGDAQMVTPLMTVFNRTCYEWQLTSGGPFSMADAYCRKRQGHLLHSLNSATQAYVAYELERFRPMIKSKLVWLGAHRDSVASSPVGVSNVAPSQTFAAPSTSLGSSFQDHFTWSGAGAAAGTNGRVARALRAARLAPSDNDGDGHVSSSHTSPVHTLPQPEALVLGAPDPLSGLPMSRGSQTSGLATLASSPATPAHHDSSRIVITTTGNGANPFVLPFATPVANLGALGPTASSSSSSGAPNSVSQPTNIPLANSQATSSMQQSMAPSISVSNHQPNTDWALHSTTTTTAAPSRSIASILATASEDRPLAPVRLSSLQTQGTHSSALRVGGGAATLRNAAGRPLSIERHLTLERAREREQREREREQHLQQQQQQQQQQQGVWRWTNVAGDDSTGSGGSPIAPHQMLWADEQPNNYNQQQDCLALDGARRWLWNDVTCELDHLPWVCQYAPVTCGAPDRQENSTYLIITENSNSNQQASSNNGNGNLFPVGTQLRYTCPQGHRLVGVSQRKCLHTGAWSDSAPRCSYIDCGPLEAPDNGRVLYLNASATTYASWARYVCHDDYVLVSSSSGTHSAAHELLRQCSATGAWTGRRPTCAYRWCPALVAPSNGSVSVSNGNAEHSVATYTCSPGHRLVGNATRQCLLGAKWTGQAPLCQYVDCGHPSPIANGRVQLSSAGATTYYLSQATYECYDNYTLVMGDAQRTCTAFGTWSGRSEPQCQLIECKQPEVPPGTALIPTLSGSPVSLTIHSTIEYECLPGHKPIGGDFRRTCVVDCGRVPAIFKGEIAYVNATTYLGSLVAYECTPGHAIVGNKQRWCNADGRWSGASPKCEEIRCGPPETPINGSAIYVGNDRSSHERSFSVGATVNYQCAQGNVVRGAWPSRVCQANGQWSGLAPVCEYVDCGAPPAIQNGRITLRASGGISTGSSNDQSAAGAASGSSLAISGANGLLTAATVSTQSSTPLALQTTNLAAARAAARARAMREHTSSSSSSLTSSDQATISDNNQQQATHYGSVAHYACDTGYRLIGAPARLECLDTGAWRVPAPTCEPIVCPRPAPDTFSASATGDSSSGGGVAGNGGTTTSVTLDQRQSSFDAVPAPVDRQVAPKVELLSVNAPPGSAARPLSLLDTLPNGETSNLEFGLGDKLLFSCPYAGYELFGGSEVRTCTYHGLWSGQTSPKCRLLDCGRPAPIGPEGRYYLLNDTTTYGSWVEYVCVRPYRLVLVQNSTQQFGPPITTQLSAHSGLVTPQQQQQSIQTNSLFKQCNAQGLWAPTHISARCTLMTTDPGVTSGASRDSYFSHNNHLGGPNLAGDDTSEAATHRHYFTTTSSSGTQDPRVSSGGNGTSSLGATLATLAMGVCVCLMLAIIVGTLLCVMRSKRHANGGGPPKIGGPGQAPPTYGASIAAAAANTASNNGANHHGNNSNGNKLQRQHAMASSESALGSHTAMAALNPLNSVAQQLQLGHPGLANDPHGVTSGATYTSRLSLEAAAEQHAAAGGHTIRHNPNGLVTFVSRSTPSVNANTTYQQHAYRQQHQASPQSMQTSLSTSASASPSSAVSSSSDNGSAQSNSSNQLLPTGSTPPRQHLPIQVQPPQRSAHKQSVPPSLPTNPPPPHRLQHQSKQYHRQQHDNNNVQQQSIGSVNKANDGINNNNNDTTHTTSHYEEPRVLSQQQPHHYNPRHDSGQEGPAIRPARTYVAGLNSTRQAK